MTVPINSEVALIGPQALADLLGRWPAADGPLYRLLATRIGRLADTGELPPGIRLPPERALAAALAVSRNTVALAYQVLRDDGMAESRQGSGTRLTPHRITPAAAHRRRHRPVHRGGRVRARRGRGAAVPPRRPRPPRAVPAHRRHRLPPVRAGGAPRGDRDHAHHHPLRPHVGGRSAGHHRCPAGTWAARAVRGLPRAGGGDRGPDVPGLPRRGPA